jgi:hypothetical protein
MRSRLFRSAVVEEQCDYAIRGARNATQTGEIFRKIREAWQRFPVLLRRLAQLEHARESLGAS